MFLLVLLTMCLSTVRGESLSIRALTANKPSVSNHTRMGVLLTSREQRWKENFNFTCETRKDDYAANEMAKTKFSFGCLAESSLGPVPQIMGKLSSCYCSFNLTICDMEIKVKSCVITGPGRKPSRFVGIESMFIYYVGFGLQIGTQNMDGRLEIMTDASDLPRNLTLAETPAAIMAAEFSGWAYRVELNCISLRSAAFCKRIAANSTHTDRREQQPLDLLAVIFGICGSLIVACVILGIHWLYKDQRSRNKYDQRNNHIYQQITPRRTENDHMLPYEGPQSIRLAEQYPQSRKTSYERAHDRLTEKRLSTYL